MNHGPSFVQSILYSDACLLEESMSRGRSHCEYRIGRGCLEIYRIAKARLERRKITKSKFADDAALYAVTRQAVERAAVTFVTIAAGWDLTVSLEKLK